MVLAWLKTVFHAGSSREGCRVAVDAKGVSCARPDGRVDVVNWSDLVVAGIQTTAIGPFVEDVYFYLEGPDYGFYIPQAAEGTEELVGRLLQLPGFDSETFAAAMSCTDDTRFVCWRKANAEQSFPPDRPRD
jgi:hypothetical protein